MQQRLPLNHHPAHHLRDETATVRFSWFFDVTGFENRSELKLTNFIHKKAVLNIDHLKDTIQNAGVF